MHTKEHAVSNRISTKRGIAAAVAFVIVGAFAIVGFGIDPAGSAQYPGVNGKIQYSKFSYNGQQILSTVNLINPDGTGDQVLVNNAWQASQNANATRLAYLSATSASLHIANFDGSGDTVVYTAAAGVNLETPSVSPDGTKIVFVVIDSNASTRDLCVINSDGTGFTVLLPASINLSLPQISPDGSTVLFTGGNPARLYTIPISGGSATAITAGLGGGEALGTWTPSGRILAVGNAGHDVLSMNGDGTNMTTILAGASQNFSNIFWPVASPDGSKFTFSAMTGQAALSLYSANIDGTGVAMIADSSVDGFERGIAIWAAGQTPTPPTTTPATDPLVPSFTG